MHARFARFAAVCSGGQSVKRRLGLIAFVALHGAVQAQSAAESPAAPAQPGEKEASKPLSVSPDSSTARLRSAIEAAMAPKWHGIAKVTETTMPVTGERLYKISNGTGEYCVKIFSPRIGIDQYEWERRNRHVITCPK